MSFLRRAMALLTLAVPALSAQQMGSIAGRVTDASAGTPIQNARVTVLTAAQAPATAPVVTGADGRYSVPVTPGTYQVYVTAIGFTAKRVSGVTVTAGQAATADAALTAFQTTLTAVAVTSTRGAPEKVLDAPAQVVTVTSEEIRARPAVTVADNLRQVPGVDMSTGGIVQSNIVSRGFNNAFSGSMLMLQDYRFAGVPSLRVNVPFLFTGTNEDIERIEVLNGPASALYGPNSGNGALHVITRSPFTSQGTTVSVDGGQQSIFRAGLRTAQTFGDQVGLKLSGEYMKGTDFRFADPAEPARFDTAQTVPADRRGATNARLYDVGRYTGEARLDWRPMGKDGDLEFITTYGMTHVNNGMELTGANGTSQIKGWTYQNLQQRMRWGRLFAQVFLNSSDAGNETGTDGSGTFLLRSGQPIVDKSKVYSAQLQHGFTAGGLDLTYGFDYIATRPNTGGTINGRNEGNADVTEMGGYVQGKYKLTSQLELLGALRVDDHSQLSGTFYSPRAALLYKPSPNSAWRVTYNRAFNTPANFAFFLDLINTRNIGGSGYDLRAVGNANGWTFDRSCATTSAFGSYCMRSPFVPGATAGTFQQVGANAAASWNGLVTAQRTALIGTATGGLNGAFNQATLGVLQAAGLTLAQAQGILGAVAGANATAAAGGIDALRSGSPTSANIPTRVAYLTSATTNLAPGAITDLTPLKATYNETYELGWKGAIGQRFSMDVAGWYQIRRDVGTPASLVTPSVFMDAGSTANQAAIGGYMGGRLQAGAITPAWQGALATALGAAGIPAGSISTIITNIATQALNGFVPAALGNLARAPLGTVGFSDAVFGARPDLMASYRTAEGRLNIWGVDASMQYLVNDNWTLSGVIGGVNQTEFTQFLDSNGLPLRTNSPGLRGSLAIKFQQDPTEGWGVELRGRYTDAFQVNSGVYNTGYCNAIGVGQPGFVANATTGTVARFNGTCPAGTFQYNAQWGGVPVNMMADLAVTYRFNLAGKGALWSLTVNNMLDNKVPSFAGVPNIGRLAMTRLSYTF